ncbi:coiled-coil domain-containing protein [Klebsiella quasipneumoniae]|uniref:phage tail protein n=1 Tax=Klebsiella quasipneumoniae TaxID=1463165 RepID=UPI0015DCC65E|nr:phage tail protein [Klebsiella quasipneumoniae]BBQ67234.1 tail protein [Klebsiella quasipneumoniae]BBR14724.1 tail protein [Klebsiella quasipneumoniae]
MADSGLNAPVVIQATRLDASILPRNIFSQSYLLYVIAQGTDLGNVAGKANEAGKGAYDAQVKNDEQDITLADHETRLTAAESTLVNHEQRITAAENTLVNHEQRITAAETELADHETRIAANETELADHETRISQNTSNIDTLATRLDTAESDVDTLETNSVSKAVSTSQSVQATGGSFLVGNVPLPTTDKLQVGGSVNISVSYKVAGLQVVGMRQTGWTAATGTALLGVFNADQAFTVGATYSQAEVQAMATALVETRQRLKALEDMARTHGLIA